MTDGLFSGKRGLRHQFAKLTVADLAGADSKASAVLMMTLNPWGRHLYIDNDLTANSEGVEIQIAVVHPEADHTNPDFRLDWIEVAGYRVINYASGDTPGVSFPPGTKFYIWTENLNVTGGSPASPAGAIRISAW